MPKIVEIPGVGNVEFPDDMPDEEINQIASQQAGGNAPPPTPPVPATPPADTGIIPDTLRSLARYSPIPTNMERASGFAKQLGQTAKSVMDVGGGKLLGVGAAGDPNSADNMIRYLSEKIGGATPDAGVPKDPFAQEDIPGTTQDEAAGGSIAKLLTYMGAGGAAAGAMGPVTAAFPGVAATVANMGAQGGAAATAASAQGDNPLVAGALGAAGPLAGKALGAAGRGINSLRARFGPPSPSQTPIQQANDLLGVTKASIKKGYRAAKAIMDEGIDLTTPREQVRERVIQKLDDLSLARDQILEESNASWGADVVRKATDSMKPAIQEAKKFGLPIAKEMRAVRNQINELVTGKQIKTGVMDPAGKEIIRTEAAALGPELSASDMRGLVKKVDGWVAVSGGKGKQDLRRMLWDLRRDLNDMLVTGEPRLKAVNPGLREFGEARRLLDDRIAKEMASVGTRPRPTPSTGDKIKEGLKTAAIGAVGGEAARRIYRTFN